jgi:glycerol-3-phosphate dehydrogenase
MHDPATTSPPDQRGAVLAGLGAGPPPVLVVGGGITGAGIALDLAQRGLDVVLVERGDWAGATSSASSRLVHGGLRYLEQLELGLVRESCLERALLLRNAAGFVWPEEFHFPIFRGDRVGRPKLVAGLWLYTALATPRALGAPHRRSPADLRRLVPGIAEPGLRGGGSYLDAATDDARLTLAVVRTARAAGARCLARTELLAAEEGGGLVRASLLDRERGERLELDCSALVLAGGPRTDELRARAGATGSDGRPWTAPSRGSHVVVPRERLPTDGAVIFTSAVDGRVMFLIPWPEHTVVGTTDLDADDVAARPRASGAEVGYLLDSANALVPLAGLGPRDVVSTWSGLRPLLASTSSNPSERSREERIDRDGERTFTIAGGKLTGYRAAAEKLAHRLTADLGLGRPGRRSATRHLRLCGALGGPVPRPAWSRLDVAGSPRALDARGIAWDARYGADAARVRQVCARAPGGEEPLDARTLLGELDHAASSEDCLGLDDLLFRRTDLGLLAPGIAGTRLPELGERLGARLGWSPERRATELARARHELAERQAWRDDPDAPAGS